MAEAQTHEVPGTGNTGADTEAVLVNDPKMRKQIASAAAEIKRLRDTRKGINEDITAALSDLVAATGVPKEAMKRALKDAELKTADLEALDHYHRVCRQALGKPVQGDLFTGDETKH